MWADPRAPPKKKKVKIAIAIFPNHYRRPFCAAFIANSKTQSQKCGTKKSGFGKGENMALTQKGITRNLARRPAGQGQEICC
jgi:hypothetical protein